MAVVVAGLFDSEADATQAMDRLLRENIEDLDTRVINGGARPNTDSPGVVVPIIPNTSGGIAQPGGLAGMAGVVPGGLFGDWLNDLDNVEQGFYQEALREGSTLALARVDEAHADKVRQLFSMFNARTYKRD